LGRGPGVRGAAAVRAFPLTLPSTRRGEGTSVFSLSGASALNLTALPVCIPPPRGNKRNVLCVNMSETIRTFIAIELPEAVLSHIEKVQKGIKSCGFKASWVQTKGIHLTLKFLGNIAASDAEKVGEAMSETAKAHRPISLSAKGIGVFPGIKKPRVIWVGLSGDTHPLIQMQKNLDENLQCLGFPKEDRPFKGHLTLARIKESIDAAKLLEAMNKFGSFESEKFTADKIILFKSELKPSGAVYTKLINVNLKG